MEKTVFLLMKHVKNKKGEYVEKLLIQLGLSPVVYTRTADFLDAIAATSSFIDFIFYYGRAENLAKKIFSLGGDPVSVLVRFSVRNLVVSDGETHLLITANEEKDRAVLREIIEGK